VPSLWTFKGGLNGVGPADFSSRGDRLKLEGIGLKRRISSWPRPERAKEKFVRGTWLVRGLRPQRERAGPKPCVRIAPMGEGDAHECVQHRR